MDRTPPELDSIANRFVTPAPRFPTSFDFAFGADKLLAFEGVRMRKIYSALILPALLLGAPAIAGEGEPEAARDADGKITDKKHPEYVRCKTEPVIGSRAKKRRVCLTNSEWARVESQSKSIARRMVADNAGGIVTN